MTRKNWVDFKRVREEVHFEQVLRDYGIELKVKGSQHQGFCPLPNHNGKKRSPSFSVNLKRNIFQCFGCGAKGNVIEFVALMEGLDPDDPAEFRKAALQMAKRYLADGVPGESESREATDRSDPPSEEDDGREHQVNVPLDFELKRLDPDHTYLESRGLTPETIHHFGVGYCNRGLMKGRIAIPLHDAEGRLIGYAGRLADEEAIDEENPRYMLPGSRERDGIVHDFCKSLFLFNGHRIEGPVERLIAVEGFFGAMWLHQHGYPNAVALMGSSCSERQAELLAQLLTPAGCLWVMPDGDEAGDRFAVDVLTRVSPRRAVRWVQLDHEKQPDGCGPSELEHLLGPGLQTAHSMNP